MDKNDFEKLKDLELRSIEPSAPPLETNVILQPPLDISLIQKERNKKILNDIKHLENKLNHYNKVRRKWSKAKNSFNILSIIIGTTATTITVVSTAGIITIPLTILSLVALAGVSETVIIQTLSSTIFTQKKKLYQKISNEVKTTISKLYVYHQKALEDGFIDNDEIEQIERILQDMEKNIISIKKKINLKKTKGTSTILNKEEIRKLKEIVEQGSIEGRGHIARSINNDKVIV